MPASGRSAVNGSYDPSVKEEDDSMADETSDVGEIDQLDSEGEEDELDDDEAGRRGERVPGDSLLPPRQVEGIIQSEGVTGNLAMSKEAVFVISIATEEFIKKMARIAELSTRTENRSVITYKDVASVTEQYQEFFFLRDTVPPPLTLAEALRRREEKQKEMEENDPALISSTLAAAAASSNAVFSDQHPSTALTKSRSRAANDKEKANGGSSRRKQRHDPNVVMQAQAQEPMIMQSGGMRGVVIGELGAETPWTRWTSTSTPNGTAAATYGEGVIDMRGTASSTGGFVNVNAESWNEGHSSSPRSLPPGSPFQGTGNQGRTIYSQHRSSS